MNPEISQETWHVEANGEVVETNFAELTTWIDEGTLLRQDRVKKGNLRWIEAGKVPSLLSVFNAKDNGQPIAPVITTTRLEPEQLGAQGYTRTAPAAPEVSPGTDPNFCSLHADRPAFFACGTCFSTFCKVCPKSYGGTVKICPYCGALCESLEKIAAVDTREVKIRAAIDEGFGFADFVRALGHPLRFKASLILGAILYMIFSLGQSAVSFGGMYMMFSAIFCFLLANMLTVGILTNTVENFTQGKLDENFMPPFDDFSIWDDVVHPFFLSIGVYLASFGPLIAVGIFAIVMILGAAKTGTTGAETDAAKTAAPGLPYAANAARQSERVREILKKDAEEQRQRVAAMDDPSKTPDANYERSAALDADRLNEENFEEMSRMIAEQRKAQLESAIGKTPETVQKEQAAMFQQLLSYGVAFILLAGLALLWGLFYFPAACAVAGYTRSFWATINPLVGLDTIRRLGSTYVLILLMGLLLIVASSIVGGFLGAIFSPFDMPSVGNLPAKAIGSLFGFYFSVVFSCVIGYALFKASDRLKLYR